jgi:hypothetical protein
MRKSKFTLFLLGVFLLSFCSCATLSKGRKKPVFLKMNKETENNTAFYIDGQKMDTKYVEYSRDIVSFSSNSTTYQVTMLPALMLRPNKKYYTLKIENPSGTKEILLKRDLMYGYKAMLVMDMYFTVGTGTLIDIFSNSLYGYPSINVESLNASTQKQFYYVETNR